MIETIDPDKALDYAGLDAIRKETDYRFQHPVDQEFIHRLVNAEVDYANRVWAYSRDEGRFVMPGYSKYLEATGASKDTVEFTRRHEARYTEADKDASWWAGWRWGVALGVMTLFWTIVLNVKIGA